MFRADALRELGYLDEVHYYLGDDDHDFNRRAYAAKGWKAAYRYVHFFAPLNLSPQRGQKVELPQQVQEEAQLYRAQRKAQRNGKECRPAVPKGDINSNTETRSLVPKEATTDTFKDSVLPPLPPLSTITPA